MKVPPEALTSAFVSGVLCAAFLAGCTTTGERRMLNDPMTLSEPPALLLWPEGRLDVTDDTPEEATTNRTDDQNALGLNRSISHVSVPTYAVHLPGGAPPTDAPAVVVCPGGGFRRVVIDKEGHDIARWLNKHGIVAVVLKYRTGPMGAAECLADAQRTIRTVRVNAAALGVCPNRIGIMGFSAGGHLALRAALHYDSGNPEAEDPIDRVSSRPDFVGMGYPAVPADIEARVDAETPPAFFVHSFDDGVPIEGSVQCFQAWKKAGVRAEAHFYATGGHAYGLGVKGGPVTSWPDRFLDWLDSLELTTCPPDASVGSAPPKRGAGPAEAGSAP